MFKRKLMLGTTAGLIGALAIAGAAFADTGSPDGHPGDSIKDRVAEILGIEREALDSAMSTAREEHKDAKQDERLAALVEAGTITQEQADEIDAWEDAKPEIMDGLKRLAKEYGGVRGDLEATLATLVEQEVITQAEADEVTAWTEAKPDYLDALREEMRGTRDHDGEGRRGRHPHSRHHRGGPRGNNGDHGPRGNFGPQGEVTPDSGTGTSFTFPDGSEVNL
jgi:hypothetical protein